MAQIEFVTYVEIPVRVFAEYQKKEYATQTYPGCPEAIGIDDIEICLHGDEGVMAKDLKSLIDSILVDCSFSFMDEAWERR